LIGKEHIKTNRTVFHCGSVIFMENITGRLQRKKEIHFPAGKFREGLSLSILTPISPANSTHIIDFPKTQVCANTSSQTARAALVEQKKVRRDGCAGAGKPCLRR